MKRTVLAVLLLTACGESALPPPDVISITPNSARASEATPITVQVDGVLPTALDYDRSSTQVNADVSLLVGTLAVGTGSWQPKGALTGLVPSLLAPGSYDVQVAFADGRMGVLPKAFSVSAGKWPSSYTLDAIPNQRAGVPFTISVKAQGPNGAGFHGNVLIHVLKASTITPSLSDPFVAGALTQQVTIPDAATGVIVFVTDTQGDTGVSNAFDVSP